MILALSRTSRVRAVLAAVTLCCAAGASVAQDLTVHAAASLRGALDEVATLWSAETGGELTLVYAGSSALARQIAAGAPGDVVLSANTAWMDLLEDEGLLLPGSRVDLLSNRLVVIAGGADAPPLDLSAPAALADRIGSGRLAMALTGAVPAGIYAREALTSLGLWDAVAPRVVEADNVRAALALVATGAAPVGIVYATDALAEPRVSVIAELPGRTHRPIIYPAAALAAGDTGASTALLALMQAGAARDVFRAHGFGWPE